MGDIEMGDYEALAASITARLGPARGKGIVYVIPMSRDMEKTLEGEGGAYLMCVAYPTPSVPRPMPLTMKVPMGDVSPELIATLQLYLAA